MAGKKRAQTPEERLAAALVPQEEWPYEAPENWRWTRVESLATIHRGVSYKKPDAHSNPSEGSVLILRGGNIGEGTIDIDADNVYVDESLVSSSQLIRQGDIVIVASTGSTKVIGRAGVSDKDYTDVAFGAFLMLVRPIRAIQHKYLGYYFQSMLYRNRIRQLAAGVNINNIRADYITSMPIALPPLPEQRRIATRIERLFSKLDEAEAKLREVIDSSEQRQAAILHKAFSGELSKSWRKRHYVERSTWAVKRFDEVAYIRSNLVDPAAYTEYPHIAPDNIEKKTGVLLPYSTIGEDGVTSGKHHFYPGQILYSKIRPYLSKAVVVDFEGLCSADMYPIEAMEDTRYLWYFILSEDFLEQTYSAGSRTVLPKINQKGLSAIKVPIPTIAEQRYLSDALDTYFERSREADMQAMQAIREIQDLRQSILSKALRGDLGTNNPNDPDAESLLVHLFATDTA